MKIVMVDNYNRDNIPDVLICDNINNEYYGESIVEFLNYGRKLTKEAKENQTLFIRDRLNRSTFYKLVDDEYRLYRGDSGD